MRLFTHSHWFTRNVLIAAVITSVALGACGDGSSTTDPMDGITVPTFPVSEITWGGCAGDNAPEELF